jgi:hypothetical protein
MLRILAWVLKGINLAINLRWLARQVTTDSHALKV